MCIIQTPSKSDDRCVIFNGFAGMIVAPELRMSSATGLAETRGNAMLR